MLHLSIIAATAAGTGDPVDALWYPSVIPRSMCQGSEFTLSSEDRLWALATPASSPLISQMSDIALIPGLALCEPNHIDHRWGSLGCVGVILTN